ncbi:MAG TPA: hypothetical protein VHB77_03240 [Planctomycetaceae bacterium]|nr:hypothetical protein [Planctomycetaceae bacterium]
MTSRIRWGLLLVCVFGCALAQSADAAVWYRRGAVGVPFYGGGYGGYGYGGFGGVGTVASSNMQGMSSMIRSAGEYNYMTTAAMQNYQEARSQYIDNQVKWQQAYHQMHRSAEAYFEENRAARAASRDRWLASRGSGAPPRLSTTQIDMHTGQIHWPDVLKAPEYAQFRNQLEQLFFIRAQTTGSEGIKVQIRDTVKGMSQELKSHIRELPPNDYLEARKFLESLGYEVNYASNT